MIRTAMAAEHKMNPNTTERFETGFRSGDTLPDADWETPRQELELGSVQNGLAYKAPLYEGQPEYSTEKIYKDRPKAKRRA